MSYARSWIGFAGVLLTCACVLTTARAQDSENQPSDEWETPHYDEGFVLVSSPPSANLPFRLKLNHVSQFKYINTMAVEKTYTDHLGNEKVVDRRNDIQLTRDVFYFSGYVFDPKLDFNFLIFMSSATLSVTAAGYVGYAFDKRVKLRIGYFSLPSLRSMTGTYPFFHGTDRSMETNYMRPGFTQGIWLEGELFPRFNYIAMVGNSLNTLDIATTRIDTRFAYSANIWYDLNGYGKPWNDWESHDKPSLRIGTAFTFSREDRLSDLSTANPENNHTFLSDGSLLFAKGSLAEDVTVQRMNYYSWAIDAGFKYSGFAANFEFVQRWLNDFEADGPLPYDSFYDWGFDASLGYFVLPKTLELYARGSLVHGRFRTPYEAGGGFNWYPFDTRQVWINAEAIGIDHSPYGGGYYMYSVGQTGVLFQSQFLLRF
jgi:hypothetical protein